MQNPLLLPELVESIVGHLPDVETVENCALISRTWVTPCQRALFYGITLSDFYRASPFLHHLLSYPHLQNHIHWMIMWQTPTHIMGQTNYVCCLAALFPLLPRLIDLHVTFDRSRFWTIYDYQFIEAFNGFLHTSQSLTDLYVHNLPDETDLQQMFSYLEGTNIKHVSLDTESRSVDNSARVRANFFTSTLRVVHLPAIERLSLDLADIQKLCPALNFWLGQHPPMFPNLQHCVVVVNRPCDVGLLFRDVLQPVALQLESFRLELIPDILEDLPISPGIFEGLHVNHFKLCISKPGIKRNEARSYINWVSSMFRSLADSRTVIHFTELTFTFNDPKDVEAVSADWATLDEVLSHSAFMGVQRIYFEDDNHKWVAIAGYMQPELVSVIRRTLPRLASRGVLCF